MDLVGVNNNLAGESNPKQEGIWEQLRRPGLTEILQEKRDRTAAQLADYDAAISALTANPELEKLLNLLQQAGRY